MAAILIIDDEPDYCEVVGRYLDSVGHQVRTASSTSDIRDALIGPRPDIVLMDVRMPDVNGLELLPQIKLDMDGVPVLVITALDDYRIADLLYEAGADGFLTKPLRFEELSENIDRLIPHPHRGAAQCGARKAECGR